MVHIAGLSLELYSQLVGSEVSYLISRKEPSMLILWRFKCLHRAVKSRSPTSWLKTSSVLLSVLPTSIWVCDERHEYNYKKPTGFTEETGHFTQLVWRSTLQVGCAAVDCGYDDPDLSDIKDENGRFRKAQGWYVVCEYAPAGNIVGKGFKSFKANVRPPRTGSSDDNDDGSGGAGAAGARGYVGGSIVLIVLVNAMFLLL